MIILDGTFTTSNFRQTLLFAVCPDPNNQVTLLAWALVESENQDSWQFFAVALPGIIVFHLIINI